LRSLHEVIADWQIKRDSLPNLQLLEGRENQSKLKTPFAIWLKNEYPKEGDQKNYLHSHNIPDVSLALCDFSSFFEKRRVLLKEKLAELLDVPLKKGRT
jgi:hypothetical protein